MASDRSLFLPAAREICERHALPTGEIAPFPDGSTPVFALGAKLVLKLYCPWYLDEFLAETAALEAIGGSLSVPTPEIVAQGSIEGWPYLVISRLAGHLLQDVFPGLSRSERAGIIEEMGVALAALHGIDLGGSPPALAVDWPRFLEERLAGAVDRQRRRGLEPRWAHELEHFLDEHGQLLDRTPPPVLLHTEPTDSAWLVQQKNNRPTLSGLIDFADAMTGDQEYDHVAVGIFISRGDRRLFRRYLLAYGYRTADLDEELSTRLMMLTLVHRYCHLPRFLALCPPPWERPSIERLAGFWFQV
ncbi:MAG: aminoglycoside phosphotransferase family protein [Bradymonadales bacterium]|nr:aminoglycoside phosphotransferase family protein [Bradymonadales bacterium]